jgi:hypothetical protein
MCLTRYRKNPDPTGCTLAPTPYKTKKAGIGTAIPRPADYKSASQFIELCPLATKMKTAILLFVCDLCNKKREINLLARSPQLSATIGRV